MSLSIRPQPRDALTSAQSPATRLNLGLQIWKAGEVQRREPPATPRRMCCTGPRDRDLRPSSTTPYCIHVWMIFDGLTATVTATCVGAAPSPETIARRFMRTRTSSDALPRSCTDGRLPSSQAMRGASRVHAAAGLLLDLILELCEGCGQLRAHPWCRHPFKIDNFPYFLGKPIAAADDTDHPSRHDRACGDGFS